MRAWASLAADVPPTAESADRKTLEDYNNIFDKAFNINLKVGNEEKIWDYNLCVKNLKYLCHFQYLICFNTIF